MNFKLIDLLKNVTITFAAEKYMDLLKEGTMGQMQGITPCSDNMWLITGLLKSYF